jgi:catechol 2,3-dioxygenase-like lactoylglutathione lyase family enzyme
MVAAMEGAEGYLVSGIQQIGVGVRDLEQSWRWYRRHLGLDIPVFRDDGEAALMLPYTGGLPQARKAVLAVNLQGGGGLEVWQYARRLPLSAAFTPEPGDLGIYAPRLKARDVPAAHARFQAAGLELLGPVEPDPAGTPGFFLRDPFGNPFQVVAEDAWFQRGGSRPTGGVSGAMIGVKQLEPALGLYRDILGFDRLVYDRQGVFPDLAGLPGGRQPVRRVLLAHSRPRRGAFSELLGPGRLELVQALERAPRKIFSGRFWGDLGFIHLCFDVRGMEALKERCAAAGFPFTVDSAQAFVMGEASGRFAYVEDPDGTLVEFVETYRLALLRRLGWYLDLRRRPAGKRLPRWLLAALGLNRVRDRRES